MAKNPESKMELCAFVFLFLLTGSVTSAPFEIDAREAGKLGCRTGICILSVWPSLRESHLFMTDVGSSSNPIQTSANVKHPETFSPTLKIVQSSTFVTTSVPNGPRPSRCPVPRG